MIKNKINHSLLFLHLFYATPPKTANLSPAIELSRVRFPRHPKHISSAGFKPLVKCECVMFVTDDSLYFYNRRFLKRRSIRWLSNLNHSRLKQLTEILGFRNKKSIKSKDLFSCTLDCFAGFRYPN